MDSAKLTADKEKDIIISAFSNLYLCAYYLDLSNNAYFELHAHQYIGRNIPASGNCLTTFNKFLRNFVSPPDQAVMQEFLNLSNLEERLIYGPIYQDYRSDISGWCRAVFSVAQSDENGNPLYILFAVQSINGDKREQERRLSVVSALSQDYSTVLYIDYDANLLIPYRLNPEAEKKHGAYLSTHPRYSEAIEHYLDTEVLPADREMLRVICSFDYLKHMLHTTPLLKHQYRIMHDGQTSLCHLKIVRMEGDAESHRAVLGISRMPSLREEELEHYAYTDALTGDYNFNYFKEQLYDRHCLGTLIDMDIRAFRTINLAVGVAVANDVLRQVWLLVKNFLCKNDLAAHINGDQFAIFLTERDRNLIIRRLISLTSQIRRLAYERKVPMLTACFGLTAWNAIGEIENALGDAASSKNKIKSQADKNIAFFDGNDAIRVLEEKDLEDKFEQAIINEHFEAWYQPKFAQQHAPDKPAVLVGAEALVRWRDAAKGLIPPGKFIPVFERNGMVRTLDEYIFRHVCLQLRNWQRAGLKVVPVSINLSRASLYAHGIAARYRRIADSNGVNPNLMPIEITESATIDNDDIASIVKEFNNYGFSLHVDDFGSGYSSLATLNMLPFDTLKLDKSLIDYIGEEKGDRLLRHIIELAHDLGMHVTAEGVEEAKQASFLWNLSCDNIQGYFFAKPLPVEEFTKLLQA